MKILVVNAGSSSLKYQFIDMTDESVIAKGICERIGGDSEISHKTGDIKFEAKMPMKNHTDAFQCVIKCLTEGETKAIDDFINSKIESTYIVIDPMFEDCVFERDGWYKKFRKTE